MQGLLRELNSEEVVVVALWGSARDPPLAQLLPLLCKGLCAEMGLQQRNNRLDANRKHPDTNEEGREKWGERKQGEQDEQEKGWERGEGRDRGCSSSSR